MTGDNAPPPGGVAPLRVIGNRIACTVDSRTIYLATVSGFRCAAVHMSSHALDGLRRSPAPGMLGANSDIPTLPT